MSETKVYPHKSEFQVEKFGMTMFEVNIESYQLENNLADSQTAWLHLIDTKLLPHLQSLQARLLRLEEKSSPPKKV